MKKRLLFGIAMILSLGVMAQMPPGKEKVRIYNPLQVYTLPSAEESISIPASPIQPLRRPQVSPASFAVTKIPVGASSNANGNAFTARKPLFADPVLNSVVYLYRNQTVLFGGTSGQLRYALSTNGGSTFSSNVGPIYNATGDTVAPFANARYPFGGIYNPTGNTNPANAYVHFFAPSLARQGDTIACLSSGQWGGKTHGAVPFGGGTSVVSEELANDVLIPDDAAFNQGDNSFWIVTMRRAIGAAPCGYLDQLTLGKGVWNGTEYVYTYQNINAPVASRITSGAKLIDQCRIAWAPNGQIGYVTYIGHESFTDQTDSTRYPVVFKTTDAGANWNRVAAIDLTAIDAASLQTGRNLSIEFDHSISVDANGNLHIIAGVMPMSSTHGYFNIVTPPGFFAIFDISTTDGGNTWNAHELGFPVTSDGNYLVGTTITLQEFNRPQICRTADGNRMFFTWFDSNVTIQVDSNNITPDAYIVGYNVNTNQWTEKDSTTNSDADGLLSFATVAPIALNGSASGCYKIPLTGLEILTNVSSPVNHSYYDGIEICDPSYTVTKTPIPLTNMVSVKEVLGNSSLAIGQNYPNPFRGETKFDINLKTSGNVTVDIVNVLGKSVKSLIFTNLHSGVNTLTIDGNDLAAGIYTYTVAVGSEKISRNMMVK